MICWYAVSCDPAAGIRQRRQRSPWYTAKATPAAADMHAALRDALTQARINAVSPASGESRKSAVMKLTSNAQAALLRNTRQEVPGCYLFLGACPDDGYDAAEDNHSPRAVFDDAVMTDGCLLHAHLAIRSLRDLAPSTV